jgi:hypothetical protein
MAITNSANSLVDSGPPRGASRGGNLCVGSAALVCDMKSDEKKRRSGQCFQLIRTNDREGVRSVVAKITASFFATDSDLEHILAESFSRDFMRGFPKGLQSTFGTEAFRSSAFAH